MRSRVSRRKCSQLCGRPAVTASILRSSWGWSRVARGSTTCTTARAPRNGKRATPPAPADLTATGAGAFLRYESGSHTTDPREIPTFLNRVPEFDSWPAGHLAAERLTDG